MISIINYGLGNVTAFKNIYKRLNIDCKIVSDNNDLKKASKIVLPGVGAFDWAMDKLNESGMRETLDKLVLEKEVPIIGICVGMQMMAKSSEEGVRDGLGWIDARVKKFTIDKNIVLPHMGWNDIELANKCLLFQDLELNSRFYFLHSYYFKENNVSDVVTKTTYGSSFTSSVKKNNIYGIQFHPEKSHHWGEKLLKNFSNIEHA
tara:strand:+ start:10242 stop:10856 length:615 start_codon:yes stop_codon:yes gene_type:complete